MVALAVVEDFDEIEELGLGLDPGGEGTAVDQLEKGSEKGSGKGVSS